ncbi:hypothetical protein, partial [Armatimonas sp.]|uniref:hypothetical protein n=1 Tax=Armatimonas sp. TaxID=1872638 RepID=UPI00286BA4CC
LRFRGLTSWLLWGASVSTVIFGVLFLYNEPNAWVPRWKLNLSFANFLAAAVCMTFATLLFLLGRWLGRQEDTET